MIGNTEKQPLHYYAIVPDHWPNAHILVDFYQTMELPTADWERARWEELEDDHQHYWGDDDFPTHTVWLGVIAGKQYVIRQGWLGSGYDDDTYEYEEVTP